MHAMTGEDVVFAVDGRDGWGRPAIGTPSLVDIDLAGHKVRKGCKIWPIGTWPLKGAFYADLRKDGARAGAERDPDGYCHFPTWLDETYFRQITAEHLADETFKGRPREVWKIRASEKDNHLLDARVYNLALLEHLGASSMTPADWAVLVKLRGAPEHEAGLFAPKGDEAKTSDAPAASGATSAPPTAPTDADFDAELDRLLGANAAAWDGLNG